MSKSEYVILRVPPALTNPHFMLSRFDADLYPRAVPIARGRNISTRAAFGELGRSRLGSAPEIQSILGSILEVSSTTPVAPSGVAAPSAHPTKPQLSQAPFVSTELLSDDEVLDVRRQPDVAGVAMEIPVTLIKPLDLALAGGVPASESPTPPDDWGLLAVHAHPTPKDDDKTDLDGSGVCVAVLDTGLNTNKTKRHKAFKGIDITARDFTGKNDASDDNGHGTHCAATIVGRDVNGRRMGVARGVKKLLIGKVLDSEGRGTSTQLYDGILWAVREGANIISISIGFDFVGYTTKLEDQKVPHDAAVSRALEGYRSNLRLFDKLMALLSSPSPLAGSALIVAAAGNESHAADQPPFRIGVSLPAAAERVVAVGAIGPGGPPYSIAPFSNTFVQICAPGVGIMSADWRTRDRLMPLTGTSAACPIVAGVAALWWQKVTKSLVQATPDTVWARLSAAAAANCFAGGVGAADRGVGLVQAP